MITIGNRRIIDFCNRYPNFNIEDTVVSFIEFVEKICDNTVPSLDSNLATQILINIKNLQTQVGNLDSTITDRQNQYINRFAEFRKDYIVDIANILTVNNAEKIIKFFLFLKKI